MGGSGRGDLLIGIGLVAAGILLSVFATWLVFFRPGPRLIEVCVPGNVTINAGWSGACYPGRPGLCGLGLGEYVLREPLRVVGSNGTAYLLEPGVTLGSGSALLKPVPLLLLIGISLHYAAITLYARILRGEGVPWPPAAVILIALAAALLFAPLYPAVQEITPGSTAYLHIEKSSVNGTTVVVEDGILMSPHRLVVDAAMRIAILVLLTGLASLLASAGLLIILVEPRSPGRRHGS